MTTESIGFTIKKQAKPAVLIFFLLTLIVGIIYPLVVTGIAQVIFPVQANGDLLEHNGQGAGSVADRPAVLFTAVFLGPSLRNIAGTVQCRCIVRVQSRARITLRSDTSHRPGSMPCTRSIPVIPNEIPVDLVTASGSGLDPDISVAAAEYQVPRVCPGTEPVRIRCPALVASQIEPRQFGIFGEPAGQRPLAEPCT